MIASSDSHEPHELALDSNHGAIEDISEARATGVAETDDCASRSGTDEDYKSHGDSSEHSLNPNDVSAAATPPATMYVNLAQLALCFCCIS